MNGTNGNRTPRTFGIVIFPTYEPLDIAGPLETFLMLSRVLKDTDKPIKVVFLAETLKPVSLKPLFSLAPSTPVPGDLDVNQLILPDQTFDQTEPGSLDVLLIPGGIGAGDSTITPVPILPVDAFVKNIFPSLRYVITVCTGAAIAARAGILDGLEATTNKSFWNRITPLGKKTYWKAHARWVRSKRGKVWTTSGVSAGTDGAIAWVEHVFGKEIAKECWVGMEYNRTATPGDDPFCDIYGCQDVPPVEST